MICKSSVLPTHYTDPITESSLSLAMSRFLVLTCLIILTVEWIGDWRWISQLPETMTSLQIFTLTNEMSEDGTQKKSNSLAVFNQLQNLHFLCLKCEAEDSQRFNFCGDLQLPALQELYLEDEPNCGRSLASNRTFKHIPASCKVFCCLDISEEAARQWPGYREHYKGQQ